MNSNIENHLHASKKESCDSSFSDQRFKVIDRIEKISSDFSANEYFQFCLNAIDLLAPNLVKKDFELVLITVIELVLENPDSPYYLCQEFLLSHRDLADAYEKGIRLSTYENLSLTQNKAYIAGIMARKIIKGLFLHMCQKNGVDYQPELLSRHLNDDLTFFKIRDKYLKNKKIALKEDNIDSFKLQDFTVLIKNMAKVILSENFDLKATPEECFNLAVEFIFFDVRSPFNINKIYNDGYFAMGYWAYFRGGEKAKLSNKKELKSLMGVGLIEKNKILKLRKKNFSSGVDFGATAVLAVRFVTTELFNSVSPSKGKVSSMRSYEVDMDKLSYLLDPSSSKIINKLLLKSIN